MKTDVLVGEKVKLLQDVRDAYNEVYLSEGEIVEIEEIKDEFKGYEFGIPYGFFVGRHAFQKLSDAKDQTVIIRIKQVIDALDDLTKAARADDYADIRESAKLFKEQLKEFQQQVKENNEPF